MMDGDIRPETNIEWLWTMDLVELSWEILRYQRLKNRILDAHRVASAALRDQLVAEIRDLTDGDDLALWAHRRLSAKNTLTAADAGARETSP